MEQKSRPLDSTRAVCTVNKDGIEPRLEIKSVLASRALNRLLANMATRTTFRQVFSPRWVNSFYYDTAQFDYLNSNLSGDVFRQKFRCRWYGKRELDAADEIYFECKIKRAGRSTKRRVTLVDVCEPENFDFTNVEQLQASIPGNGWTMAFKAAKHHCSLGVRYLRTYHADAYSNRLTIDHGCYYFDPKIERRRVFVPKTIVELKCGEGDLQAVSTTISSLELSPVRHSKYVTGLSYLMPVDGYW